MKIETNCNAAKPADLATYEARRGFLSDQQIQKELADTCKQALAQIDGLDTALNRIQTMDAQGVATLQGILGNGFAHGLWQTPRKWLPLAKNCELNIDLRSRICWFLEDRHKQIVREADKTREEGRQAAEAGNAAPLPTALSHTHRVLDGAVLTITRFLVLCRMGPSGMGRRHRHRPLDVASLREIAYTPLPILMAIAVSKWLDNSSKMHGSPDAVNYMDLVQRGDLERFSSNQQRNILAEVARMKMLSEMDLWADVQILEEPLSKVTDPTGISVQPQPKIDRDPHLPLPDDYVAEMGSKTLWIIQELGPNLLEIARQLLPIWRRTAGPSDRVKTVKVITARMRRNRAVQKYLQGYVWRDSFGAAIKSTPFELRLSTLGDHLKRGGKKSKAAGPPGDSIDDDGEGKGDAVAEAEPVEILSWPPRNYAQIVGLWGVLQRAHLFVVGMAEGPRSGEALSLQRDCVEYAVNGMPYSNGLTFKLKERFEGELRDWVLPDVAVVAIEQQSRLMKLVEPIGLMTPVIGIDVESLDSPMPPVVEVDAESETTKETAFHLWGKIGSTHGVSEVHERLTNPNKALRGYAKALVMSTKPSGQNIRFHRFRKTLARIAALALTDSAKILMDVFGHKNIEMTLYYILADKDLQADIQKVSRELQVMRAKDAIETMVAAEEAFDALRKADWVPGASSAPASVLLNGGFGGGAAPQLAHAIKEHRERVHKQARDWGVGTMSELAERFTAMGMAWDYVRPGVMCIKRHTQVGSCTHKIGKRDSSNCRSDCDYHLVHPTERASVDGSIRDCLQYYNEAGETGNDWMQEVWAAQITSHITTFDDLHAKWMADPIVRRLVEQQD